MTNGKIYIKIGIQTYPNSSRSQAGAWERGKEAA